MLADLFNRRQIRLCVCERVGARVRVVFECVFVNVCVCVCVCVVTRSMADRFMQLYVCVRVFACVWVYVCVHMLADLLDSRQIHAALIKYSCSVCMWVRV